MKLLENNCTPVRAEGTRAAKDMSLGWHAALLHIDGNKKYSCSLWNTGERLLLT